MAGDKAYVPVVLEVDGASLLANTTGTALPAELYIYAMDTGGAVHDFVAQTLGLDIAKAGAQLRQGGLKFFGHVDLYPGDYTIRVMVRNGATGASSLRVVPVRDEAPGPERWLVLRRSLGETPELKTYLCNAPVTTPHRKLVWASGMRWPVESAIEESKGEVGLDQYEVRGWLGWHHHTALSFLAHHFLVRQRCRLREKISSINGAASEGLTAGGAAAKGAGCQNSARDHRVHTRPELRGVSLPPKEDRRPARHILAN